MVYLGFDSVINSEAVLDVLGPSVVVNRADVTRTSSTLFSIMKHSSFPTVGPWSLNSMVMLFSRISWFLSLLCGITSDNAVFFLSQQ